MQKDEHFSDRLRGARARLGLNQEELAAKLGVSKGSVGNWESGVNKPRIGVLRHLASLLRTTPEYLLDGSASSALELRDAGGADYGEAGEEEGPRSDHFATRLRTRRNSLGLSQQELADKSQVALRSIQNWEHGMGSPRLPLLRTLAEALGVDVAWLIDGTAESQPDQTVNRHSGTKAPPGKCPVVSWARAGEATSYDDVGNHLEEFIDTESKDPNCFAVIVEGDSMEPRFFAGDRVVVSPNSEPRNNDFVIARLRETGGVLLKRFRRTGKLGQTVVLESLNQDYPPQEYPASEFRFIYPVVEMLARFRR